MLGPQAPGHGFLHFWFIHARLLEHSLLIVHSGLQFGGFPIIPSTHEHAGESPETLHCELGPHGEGTHGFVGIGSNRISSHRVNGSPVYFEIQVHTGL